MAGFPLFRYSVTGRGTFPLDMLRFDCCWPRYQQDTGMLFESLTEKDRNTRTIHLVGMRGPSIGRWQSFGWQCTEPQPVAQ